MNDKPNQYNSVLSTKLKNVHLGVLVTAELLPSEYGALLNTQDLAAVFGVKEDTIKQRIFSDTFYFPLSK